MMVLLKERGVNCCLLFFAAVLITGCSLGYDNEGPFPYSHVNKKPPAPQPTRTASRNVSSSPLASPRTKPSAPVVTNASAPTRAKTTRITVRKGDTVYAVSRRHDASVRSIINLNKLRPPYLLKAGQWLNVPIGSTYIVKKGDTVYGVSRANGILMNELVRMNGIRQPYALKVGQSLKIPTTTVKHVAIAPPPKVSGKGFMWPVRGSVLSNYGPKQAGYHNDGVNISAARGTSVFASESGVVVHASNKLKGYGNLILIKHQNGWVTAYAHNDKLLVQKGQQVTRGQVVAQVGQTGRVTRPQLHFEMRKGSRTVNPTLYLKS